MKKICINQNSGKKRQDQNIKMLNKGHTMISIHIRASGKLETSILVPNAVVTAGNPPCLKEPCDCEIRQYQRGGRFKEVVFCYLFAFFVWGFFFPVLLRYS